VVPLALRFDTVGPLCRSVEDAALLLAALEGGRQIDLEGASLKGRKLAVLRTSAFDDLREAPRAAFEAGVERLAAAGARIETIEVPEVAEAMPLAGCVYTAEAYGLWRDVIEANPEAMFAEILERFRLGRNFSGPDYVAAWAALERMREGYLRATAGYDAVLAPTVPILPPNLDRLIADHDYFVSENLMALRNTRIGNLMGLCALTLPTGTPSCGLMLMAPPHTEAALLRIGAAAEKALA
jgi:aspartyl-tRNA(Asn)/glutamyl-tRNA(Gln) amidotransferase subunit A